MLGFLNAPLNDLQRLAPPRRLAPYVREFETARLRTPRVAWSGGRWIDLASLASRTIAVLSLPIWGGVVMVLWAFIKIKEPRHSAFFAHTRVGHLGQPIVVYKLRTMVPNAEALKPELVAPKACTSIVERRMTKSQNDPRVTPFGRFLRASHLDELPQMWNVLKGDMNIVGPRPLSLPLTEYEPWMKERLQCKPGVTGAAQIVRSSVLDFAERTRLDVRYVRKRRMKSDLEIVLQTFRVAFIHRKGI